MDILFNNPLGQMYGPYFLALYAVFIVTAVVAVFVGKRMFDQSDRLALPPIPSEVDPFEIAYLRGGPNEMARFVIFDLVQKGIVEIDSSGPKPLIRKKSIDFAMPRLSPIERVAFDWIGMSREPKELFGSSGLVAALDRYNVEYQRSLDRRQLLSTALGPGFAPIRWAAVLAVLGLGAYKFIAAMHFGKSNVIFLIIFAAIGSIATSAAGKMPRLTKLGNAYLDRLREAFDSFRYQSAEPSAQSGEAGVNPLLLSVGIFGTAMLAGTMYESYNSAFQRSQASSGGCGSSCGSSCSSGDGGSSCGGGGCGGCGGGGD